MVSNKIYGRLYSMLVSSLEKYTYNRKTERKEIIKFMKKVKPKKVLDFGCNYGYFSSIIKNEINAEVYGADINKYALRRGKKKYPEVNFLTVEEVKKMKGTFDVVTINHVLEHVPNPNKTLSLLKSLLTPKGTLIITVPQERIRGDCNIPHIILCSLQEKKFTNPHVRILKKSLLSNLLSKHNMKINKHKYINLFYPLRTKKHLPYVFSMIAFCKTS